MTDRIVVAIPTLRRTERMAALLPQVLGQAEPLGATVLVVDNDPAGSAREVAVGHGVQYVAEPTRGLAAVRNRALDEAAGCAAVVFIDDDEIPSDGWLDALVSTWRRTGAAAVSGRVLTRFPDDFDDPWIVAGGFFTRVEFADGASQPVAATNNLLLDVRALQERGLRFDEAFGLTGGEDIDLTARLTRAGGVIVSCPAALVWDVVDPARLTRRWVLRRAYRVGNSASRVELRARAGLLARARLTLRGLARLAVGGAQRVLGTALGRRRSSARGARTMWRGAGMVAGAWGARYAEYARRDTEAPSAGGGL